MFGIENQKTPNAIQIELIVEAHKITQMNGWCDQNCKFNWTYKAIPSKRTRYLVRYFKIVYHFEQQQDAMAFKLKWL